MRRLLPAFFLILAACRAHNAPAVTVVPGAPEAAPAAPAAPEGLEARLEADVREHEARFGKDHPHVTAAYLKLAEFHRKHGNPEKEKLWLGRAWKAAEAGLAAVNPVAGLAVEALTAYHRRHGD